MKIAIKTEDTNFFILFPTALVLNRLSAAVAAKIIKSRWGDIDVSAEDLAGLIDFVKYYKRTHRRWEVVNISTADGGYIYVSL